ncbi:MAG TPA: LolA-like putative outer membrane lipoprotein chaperone, partial [Bacteroidales bacterium]|nr:LolA-like putative outer membrane lipoprotein chaperone [Bacteroidales bacterium]
MKFILLLLLVVIADTAFAQGENDVQAIRVLDSFSSKATKAPSVSMAFRMISADLIENRSDSLAGSIILSGDKYKLILGENTVWHNGETIWNYLSAEKEVTI